MKKKKIAIIGATGSVGKQTISVVENNRDLFDVELITSHSNKDALAGLAISLEPNHVFLTSDGYDDLMSCIRDIDLDVAIIGASGTGILAAVNELAKKKMVLGIANKESLVVAGNIIKKEAKKSGAEIIPVDSEHSAIYQCLNGNNRDDVEKIILTASGGALRDFNVDDLYYATINDVLKHPTWDMGKKITVDSATMMNKGLELIEASRLFDVNSSMLDVVIHPQSVIHSMVKYKDSSYIAQMSTPDMRIPISYALGFPNRLFSGVPALDFSTSLNLTFESPDMSRYPCLRLAMDLLKDKNDALIIAMNAANEEVVNAFIESKISFGDIYPLIDKILAKVDMGYPENIDEVMYIDRITRNISEEILHGVIK